MNKIKEERCTTAEKFIGKSNNFSYIIPSNKTLLRLQGFLKKICGFLGKAESYFQSLFWIITISL